MSRWESNRFYPVPYDRARAGDKLIARRKG